MRLGFQIKTLQSLDEVAKSKKSVICKLFGNGKPIPAAVIMSMQGRMILNLFMRGMWVYHKPEKKEFHKAVRSKK